jgi:predicted transposase YdaD
MGKKGINITDDPHPWDTLMKLLMRNEIQALASLVLPGIEVGQALDKELKTKSVQGDFFFHSILEGFPIILHFEFQKKKDVDMRRRMWEYNVNMDIMENMPVYSVLVYVMKEDDDKEDTLVGSPYVREIPGTGMGHHFTFQVIKLWEIAPEVAKQPGFEVLLPLLPLTKGGKNLETVDDMINELVARNRADLLGLGQFCAGLVFKDEISQQWLKERFDKVLDIIQESWVYQETLQKGREEGRQQGLEEGLEKGRQQGLEKGLEEGLEKGLEKGRQQGALQTMQHMAIQIVATRFPEVEQFAKAIITMISDLHQLQMLTIELSVASSQEDARRLLFSFGSAS